MNTVLLLQTFKEGHQHVCHRGSVIGGPMVVEGRKPKMVGNYIQLMLGELWQQRLGQRQGIHRRHIQRDPHPAACLGDESHIKAGIVGRQRPSVDEFQKLPYGFRL